MDKAIEFIDFIFDRYAFLDIDSKASEEEIKSQIRKFRSLYHADRVHGAADDIKQKAAEQYALVEKCAEVLLDAKLRKAYDKRLKAFKKDEPEMVYQKHYPHYIFGLKTDRIDVNFLASGETLDISPIIERAVLITQFSQEKLDRAKRLYEKMPEDDDLKANYRDALVVKLAFLEVKERYLWAAAGVHGDKYTKSKTPLMDTALIQEVVTEHITHIRDEVIPAQAVERDKLARLGYDAKPVLLLTRRSTDSAAKNTPTKEMADTIERAQLRFEELTKEIKIAAEERAEVINDLLALSPNELLHKASPKHLLIHLMVNEGEEMDINTAKVMLSMLQVDNGGQEIDGNTTDEYRGKTLADLRAAKHEITTVAVVYNRHLNQPLMEFGMAAKQVLKEAFGVKVESNARYVGGKKSKKTKKAVRPKAKNDSTSKVKAKL